MPPPKKVFGHTLKVTYASNSSVTWLPSNTLVEEWGLLSSIGYTHSDLYASQLKISDFPPQMNRPPCGMNKDYLHAALRSSTRSPRELSPFFLRAFCLRICLWQLSRGLRGCSPMSRGRGCDPRLVRGSSGCTQFQLKVANFKRKSSTRSTFPHLQLQNHKSSTRSTFLQLQLQNLRRAPCAEQLAQSSLRRAACAEQLAEQLPQRNSRRATCTEHFAQLAQSKLHKALVQSNLRAGHVPKQLLRAYVRACVRAVAFFCWFVCVCVCVCMCVRLCLRFLRVCACVRE